MRKNTALRLVSPITVLRAVRRPNAEYRTREHLTPSEVEALIEAAKSNRHGHRDATMIMVAYRHGLRASEVCSLEWSQVDFTTAALHVNRVKNGIPSTHPIRGDELRMLRRLKRDAASSFIFVSERGGPFAPSAFNWLVKRAGRKAKLGVRCHAHMLRHGCGFKLANDGHDTRSLQSYLGHSNIGNTVRYTALSATRFKDFWRD